MPQKMKMRITIVIACMLVGRAEASSDASAIPAPALVRKILENDCIICHSDPSHDFGGLDMSAWVQTPDGGMGFVHLTPTDHQIPSRETFAEIIERIEDSTTRQHMPPGYTLRPGEEYQPLHAWIEEQQGGPKRR